MCSRGLPSKWRVPTRKVEIRLRASSSVTFFELRRDGLTSLFDEQKNRKIEGQTVPGCENILCDFTTPSFYFKFIGFCIFMNG